MIIRIVKMTFKAELVDTFLTKFRQHKMEIRHFEGCQHLELLRDVDNPNIFFTYSYWNDPADLERYRQSELFRLVWNKTKPLFEARPEAWSVDRSETTS